MNLLEILEGNYGSDPHWQSLKPADDKAAGKSTSQMLPDIFCFQGMLSEKRYYCSTLQHDELHNERNRIFNIQTCTFLIEGDVLMK